MKLCLKNLAVACSALLLSAWALAAQAAFPDDGTIRFVVPFTSGGNTDVVARIVAKGMSARLKAPVIVVNKPGANAMVGAEYVAHAKPDGYTMMLGTAESLAINPHIYAKVNYDALKDFAEVGVIGGFPFALVANPKLPVKTLADFVDYARKRPGQLTFSSWGVGSTSQIAFEQFKQVTGIDMRHIAYQGAAPAITAVEAGDVDAFMVPLTVAVPQAQGGKVKLLGITNAQREPSAPSIPTMTEQGYPVVIGGWHVLVVPRDTPPDVVRALNAALNAALEDKDVRGVLTAQGLDPAKTTPDEAAQWIRKEFDRWGSIATSAHVSGN
ncbi:MAG TPA: tripartite tricarboxylate transporter substrate binding protein [Bordetella sp.]